MPGIKTCELKTRVLFDKFKILQAKKNKQCTKIANVLQAKIGFVGNEKSRETNVPLDLPVLKYKYQTNNVSRHHDQFLTITYKTTNRYIYIDT